MRFANLLLKQVEDLQELIQNQNEFIKHFKTRQDKAITDWTNNSKQ